MPLQTSTLTKARHKGGENPLRVLIIDDSALMRKLLRDILSQDSGIEVVGAASDAFEARDLIKQLNPDVLTLDVEMPRMDGITFLKNLMRLRPMPVVMVSTHTTSGASVTLDALEIGAVDFVSKPRFDQTHDIQKYTDEVISKVKIAGSARIGHAHISKSERMVARDVAKAGNTVNKKGNSLDKLHQRVKAAADRFIVIGSSTGGTEALKVVLKEFPADAPPVLITQHIPPAFSKSFAERLDSICQMHVVQADEGMEVERGTIYISPGDKHLEIVRCGAKFCCHLNDDPPVNQHKPSVEVLFHSAEQLFASKCVAVMLTGMGDDGAQAMKSLRDAGAHTIAQDEASSVVWGMPGQAVKRGAVIDVCGLQEIANHVLEKVATL